MPRKRRRNRLSSYDIPKDDIDPNVPVNVRTNKAGGRGNTDHELVRHALVDFDELGVLPENTKEQLVADLVDAIRFARAGIKAGKRGVSDQALAQQIFLSDVGCALERAGLPAKRWRKRYDDGDKPSDDAPESFFFRLAREVADVSGMSLPKDLKLPGRRAAQHQYGAMSPAMQKAQAVELAERRQRLSKLEQRLKSTAP
jgi:hypothetical protein